jgi:hypothetical protein
LKLVLNKFQFFHLVILDVQKELIINYFNENLADLLKEFKNWEKNYEYMQNIMLNSEIVKSRYYQQKWEEVCKLFLIAFEKAMINNFYPDFYIDPRHTCTNIGVEYHECIICSDDLTFMTNVDKLFTFEEDLWMNYLSYKYAANFVTNPLIYNKNNDYQTFDSYMYHTNKIQEEIDFASQVEDKAFNNLSTFEQHVNNYKYISTNDVISSGLINPLIQDNNDDYNMNVEISENLFYPIKQQENNNLSHKNNNFLQSPVKTEDRSGKNSRKQTFVVNKIPEKDSIKEVSVITSTNKDKTTETKQKYKIPFLKEFIIKFTKRENIDKKILRKFRKFLKDKLKKTNLNLKNITNEKFWGNFISENLLPPMKYVNKETDETAEFKSFNTNYMVWLMSHQGSVELYEYYLSEQYDSIVEMFTSKYNLNDQDELDYLKSYIKNMAYIFYSASFGQKELSCVGTNYIETKTEVQSSIVVENQIENFNGMITEQIDMLNNKVMFDYPYSVVNNYDIFDEVINSNAVGNR